MNSPSERRIFLGFKIAAAALLLIGAAAWWNAGRFRSTFYWANRTQLALNEMERVLVDVLNMQSSVRAFTLTGSDDVLQPYQAGDADLPPALVEMRRHAAERPGQQSRLEQLEPLVAQARTVMRDAIAARRARGLDVATDTPQLLQGQEAVEGIRTLISAMEEDERRVLRDSLRRLNLAGRATLVTIVGTIALAIAILLIASARLRRDLAARLRAEDSLRHSEERLRLMIASVTDYAIIMLDPDGKIVSWNAGANRIKGYSEAEIIRQHFSRFYPEETVRRGVPQALLAEAAAGTPAHDEGWRVRRDGTLFWANVVVTGVRDAEGKLLGYVKLTRDLTERRDAQRRIEVLNEDLQRRANLLETANRELEAFSYSVSHDLRAPLRHVDGYANLLAQHAEKSLDAQGQRFLQTISRSAKQMGTLIDDLLAFSRIGRTPLRVEPVKHARLVAEVIEDGRYDTSERKIAWDIGELPDVVADLPMLRQVWRNLLENAVKYSGKKPDPQITVRGHTDTTLGEHIFFVRDNGVGFDMAYADKLFGVFQRLHGVTEFEGTGIGLANVRRIVMRHGGRTWAEAVVDQGATIYFSLPIKPLPPLPSL